MFTLLKKILRCFFNKDYINVNSLPSITYSPDQNINTKIDSPVIIYNAPSKKKRGRKPRVDLKKK